MQTVVRELGFSPQFRVSNRTNRFWIFLSAHLRGNCLEINNMSLSGFSVPGFICDDDVLDDGDDDLET